MAKTEITVQVFEQINNLKKKLTLLGYTETEEFNGNDYYFTTLNKNESNTASYQKLLDSSIIVRSYHTKSSPQKTSMLLFKNKTFDIKGTVISEEKVSTKIDNPENTIKILNLAKLNNWLSLKQTNAFYKLEEKTLIVGTVEGLNGCFLEIEEYDSIKNLTPTQKIEILKADALNLGFNLGNDFSVKKAEMLHEKTKKTRVL